MSDEIESHAAGWPSDDWELVEDQDTALPALQLKLTSFHKRGDSSAHGVDGEEMLRRAKEMGANLGEAQAKYLLAHQVEIPADYRSYHLVFPGTVWRDPGGLLRVPCFEQVGESWSLYFRWLDKGWWSNFRFLRPRKRIKLLSRRDLHKLNFPR